jgi:hypothetical protein
MMKNGDIMWTTSEGGNLKLFRLLHRSSQIAPASGNLLKGGQALAGRFVLK